MQSPDAVAGYSSVAVDVSLVVVVSSCPIQCLNQGPRIITALPDFFLIFFLCALGWRALFSSKKAPFFLQRALRAVFGVFSIRKQ